ncbi:MAG TPA: transcriptional regulator [Pseudonocardiaceae bacterium]|nr:transcriptional regulator [Pseudonocardiaceae bacterium]
MTEESATGDWAAVAAEINRRMAELGRTQKDVIGLSGLSKATVHELQNNKEPRRRSPRTLADLSIGLDLHPDHLAAVLDGRTPPEPGGPFAKSDDDVAGRLDVIEHRLSQILDRLDQVDSEDRFDWLRTEIDTAVQRAVFKLRRPDR